MGFGMRMRTVETGTPLSIGQKVSYGDMANCRQTAVIVSGDGDGYGQACVFVEDYHKSKIMRGAIEGPGGWDMEEGVATPQEIAELKVKAAERISETRRKSEERERIRAELTEAGRKLIEAKRPEGTKAVIVAYQEIDDCDTMTDYFATKDGAKHVIAWSKHTRDIFSEMRKAAAGSDIPEVAELATADKKTEHREKYSMGAGYYLKDGSRYSTGWKVEKQEIESGYGLERAALAAGRRDGYRIPEGR